jgi:DNA polymerase III subunit chi
MTKVEVLSGVSDPLLYACKFLRKLQQAQPQRCLVCGPRAVLQRLDQQLWTFDAHSFIAHAWVEGATSVVQQHTLVWLGEAAAPANGCTVLVNLHEDAPAGWDAFERVVEFVGTEPEQVAAGRQRWRAYARPGVERVHHAAGAAA